MFHNFWGYIKPQNNTYNQKKVLLAQALIADPKVLILDEPAANLDPTARQGII
ncbi:hypothetical protein MNU24_06845 [Spiroplasma poulsonii]|nr:hypothetical protein [Spiroplasma poulsonii]UNF61623.1 hypothetical protein MNU24_06845 [Spiroplasma poulsonii]